MEQTLHGYGTLYNHQQALNAQTPVQATSGLVRFTSGALCFTGNPMIGRDVTAAGNSDDGFGGRQPTQAQ